MKTVSILRKALLGLAIVAVVLLGAQPGFAQEPANKPAVAINRNNPFLFVTPGQTMKILTELVKASKPTDLLLSVTAESSIITTLTTIGNDSSSAEGTLKVYIKIDNQIVMPTGTPGPGNPPQGDTAEVVFANQSYSRTTSGNDTIATYLQTKHAAGFNWAVLNVGSGVHTIDVYATYDATTSTDATATGVIGNRSLVVQPVKCQVNETVVDGSSAPPIAPITIN
jgi:hypothetical protein